ncbi:hypothetical protein M9Y10_001684 [Tritrichomonas musculus]|uniref:non-specific serine/threonine protein kinase n=1 Tax=Tritrichomonas musculus TaxID=1915356 RepID=A0ABR2L7N2_9EUKA
MNQCVLGDQFIIRKKIGAGSFGEIYSGENIKTHRRVAIKFEKKDCEIPQLYYESKLYTILQGGPGIPSIYWYGNDENNNALVIDMLGKSLETLFKQCNSHFSLKTVLMLAEQMITCLEYFHQKNFIHRDIKPDNFVIGLGSKSNQVYIIDFGLAKKYRDTWNHQHIQFSTGNSLTGTARYSSLNALKGSEQSRRDDLEALGYVLIYLLRGNLPWMGKRFIDKENKYQGIANMKENTTFEDLCEGFPDEFIQYFYLVRNLGFAEKPDYLTYRKIFRDLLIKEGYSYDYKYDWTLPEYEKPLPIHSASCIITKQDEKQTHNQITKQKQNQKQTQARTQTQAQKQNSIQTSPKDELKQLTHKKVELEVSSKTEKPIEIQVRSASPIRNNFTSSSTGPSKLIENPYFKKKSQDQPQQQQIPKIPKSHSSVHRFQFKLEKNMDYTGKANSNRSNGMPLMKSSPNLLENHSNPHHPRSKGITGQ